MSQEDYNYLVLELAKLFSRDNQRFNEERFLENVGYIGEVDDRL